MQLITDNAMKTFFDNFVPFDAENKYKEFKDAYLDKDKKLNPPYGISTIENLNRMRHINRGTIELLKYKIHEMNLEEIKACLKSIEEYEESIFKLIKQSKNR